MKLKPNPNVRRPNPGNFRRMNDGIFDCPISRSFSPGRCLRNRRRVAFVQWLRQGRGISWGWIGGLGLVLHGIIPTFQPAHFGRVYAAYGGFFIVLSLLWGWILDANVPDRFDVV